MAESVSNAEEAIAVLGAAQSVADVAVAGVYATLALADAIDRQTAVLGETRKDTEYRHRPQGRGEVVGGHTY